MPRYSVRWAVKASGALSQRPVRTVVPVLVGQPCLLTANYSKDQTLRLPALRGLAREPQSCICKLLTALAGSSCGHQNLESQVETITGMLFNLLSKEVQRSDAYSVENHKLILKAFSTLTWLYSDQLVVLMQKFAESNDPGKMVLALQVFTKVFENVPQTEELQCKVMNFIIMVIQKDHKPVPKALLHFIEKLGMHNYLDLPEGNSVIDYAIKIQSDSSNEEGIRIMCSRILQMVSLPKLLTSPSCFIFAFVLVSGIVTEMALETHSQGRTPYLDCFQDSSTKLISPEEVLTSLVVFSRKPYREKTFGANALRLLDALHPLTSQHRPIYKKVGQLWRMEIPQMLKTLDDHTEQSLNQEEWEDTLLWFLHETLVATKNDHWVQRLIRVVLARINYFSNDDYDDDDKAFLYKVFGFSLRASSHEILVRTMVSYLLRTSNEELQQREGIAVALSILSTKHLEIVLKELEECGARLTDSDSFILKLSEEHQQREWVLLCYTIYLSYSKIILKSNGTIFMHLNAILALVMQHYHNCVVKKDEYVKLDYLNALTILTDTLSSQQHVAFQLEFPHKLSILACMVELIREEPLTSISSPIRQKAMTIISNFRMLRPLLGIEEREEILQTCLESVLCLPATEVLQKEASSPEEAQASVEGLMHRERAEVLLDETLQSLLSLMEALVFETPTWMENCLELLDRWLNSQRIHEQEQAMSCAARILDFTAKMDNFKMEIEFTRPENLVMLVAKHCQDPVASICFQSSKAVYQLYCVLLRKKKMQSKTSGLWEDDGKIEVYSANVFNQNTFEIAKVFAEFFTQTQLTNLVLMAEEDLTDSRAEVSVASAQLMSALMEERGTDIIEVKEIVENILYLLRLQLEHDTEKETLQALCSLAGSNTHTIVPMLLKKRKAAPAWMQQHCLASWGKEETSPQAPTFTI
ncbi:maestro heat-like repeat-containing protein family member 1 [Saccopteryx bilineata]|uniref:maestro heat-like repeat-containing protein family member 1 n=1 Tax=Saccopteryx bilineata TaxID=59482 RepID=UPI0033905B5E